MFKSLSAILEKTGAWFGIIFKFCLPAFVIYRPIKTFALSITVFGIVIAEPSQSINNFGIVAFYLIYAIFIIMLIVFPKIASAVEFFLIFYYFAFMGLLYFTSLIPIGSAEANQIIQAYTRALPLVLVFLAGKIFFYIFLKKNKSILEEETSTSYM